MIFLDNIGNNLKYNNHIINDFIVTIISDKIIYQSKSN